jgi:hypothetical protein
MDDAARFRDIITAYGGKPGKPSHKLLRFLNVKGLSPKALEYISQYVLKKGAGVSAIYFYGESEVLEVNADDYLPLALRDGLLAVGSCPNGDQVAVDLRHHLGATGYIGHEEMWQVANVREEFTVLRASLGRFAEALDQGRMPLDYDDATKRQERRKKSSKS